MSIQQIRAGKLRKSFHRDNFRRTVAILFVSCAINIALLVSIYYMIISRPAPDYYATNSAGAGFITSMEPRKVPNMASKALLKPDPVEEMSRKDLEE